MRAVLAHSFKKGSQTPPSNPHSDYLTCSQCQNINLILLCQVRSDVLLVASSPRLCFFSAKLDNVRGGNIIGILGLPQTCSRLFLALGPIDMGLEYTSPRGHLAAFAQNIGINTGCSRKVTSLRTHGVYSSVYPSPQSRDHLCLSVRCFLELNTPEVVPLRWALCTVTTYHVTVVFLTTAAVVVVLVLDSVWKLCRGCYRCWAYRSRCCAG